VKENSSNGFNNLVLILLFIKKKQFKKICSFFISFLIKPQLRGIAKIFMIKIITEKAFGIKAQKK